MKDKNIINLLLHIDVLFCVDFVKASIGFFVKDIVPSFASYIDGFIYMPTQQNDRSPDVDWYQFTNLSVNNATRNRRPIDGRTPKRTGKINA